LGTNYVDEDIDKCTQLFTDFQDVFAWSYDDLKEYHKTIFQHIIPLK
jgi:hypothetical protein